MRFQAPLRLLVLLESPLVAFDLHPAVFADGRRNCLEIDLYDQSTLSP